MYKIWRKLNPRNNDDVRIMMKRATDKSQAAKTVAMLLREFGGYELFLDKNYAPKEGDQFVRQADGSQLLLPPASAPQRVNG